jgi:hypothetical protein
LCNRKNEDDKLLVSGEGYFGVLVLVGRLRRDKEKGGIGNGESM